ncbi:MAG: hypothetical protein FJ316_01095 [SAR202 cluster bacterium]|nr:hypothetical protein [SAR202 cluster bacterium]
MVRAAKLGAPFALPVRDAAEEGWLEARVLFQGQDQVLGDMALAYGRERWESSNPHVAGSAFLIAYLTRVIWPVVGQYVRERRLPKVTLDNLSLHRDGERIVGTALNRPLFAVLPGDPAAGHPDAQVAPDQQALYALLKQWLFEENLSMVVPALHRAARASYPVSRNAVAASFAQAFHWLSYGGGDAQGLLREAQRFFADPASPLFRQATVELLEQDGRRGLFARRAGCCLWWRSPRATDYCSNCILVPREEQTRRFLELLAGGN